MQLAISEGQKKKKKMEIFEISDTSPTQESH